MENRKHSYRPIYKTLPVLLILLTIYTAAAPPNIFAFVENTSAPRIETAAQDDFDKKFREGRDLIDKEDWARAAEKFSEVTKKYPTAKSADAALYWLAFCHKKQKQFAEAAAALNQLLEKFPASSWTNDARVMKAEITVPRNGIYTAAATVNGLYSSTGAPGTLAPASPLFSRGAATAPNTAQTYAQTKELVDILNAPAARTPLDREDEIKIAAFQSLLAADPKRAIEKLSDILSADSKASETLKQEILRVLRTSSASDSHLIGFSNEPSVLAKEHLPLVRDALIKALQKESSVKLRKEMIYSLAYSADAQAIEYLKKHYAGESDREIKKAIIYAFSNSSNAFYAYNLNGASSPQRKTELGVLLEIVRTEKDAELRQLAFGNLQRFQNWSAEPQVIETMTRLYDSETSEAFKIFLIRSLSVAKQNQATRKLLDIAGNDRSDKLRLEAIRALRTSKDPEVLKFLEQLIK